MPRERSLLDYTFYGVRSLPTSEIRRRESSDSYPTTNPCRKAIIAAGIRFATPNEERDLYLRPVSLHLIRVDLPKKLILQAFRFGIILDGAD